MSKSSQMAQSGYFPLPSVQQVLRQIWPRHARKKLAQAADVSPRTAQNWLDGRCCPRADDLLRIAARDAEARAKFQRVLEEIDYAERRLAQMAGLGVLPPGRDVGASRALAKPVRGLARPAARADRRAA